MSYTIDIEELTEVTRRVELLGLSKRERQSLLRRVARYASSSSKKRITQQRDLGGRLFEPRKKKKKGQKKKMLTGLRKRVSLVKLNDEIAEIGFKTDGGKRIASEQQEGFTKTLSKKDIKKRKYQTTKLPASRQQAKAAIALGFRIKNPSGKGSKKPTIKYIVSNYTAYQIGYVIRKISEWKGAQQSDTYVMRLPPRSFLGLTQEDLKEIGDIISEEIDNLYQKRLRAKG